MVCDVLRKQLPARFSGEAWTVQTEVVNQSIFVPCAIRCLHNQVSITDIKHVQSVDRLCVPTSVCLWDQSL